MIREKIAFPAIQFKGHTYTCPGRHKDVIEFMLKEGLPAPIKGHQGFVTTKLRFVDRKEGMVIAKEAGQLIRNTGPQDILFSEDLW